MKLQYPLLSAETVKPSVAALQSFPSAPNMPASQIECEEMMVIDHRADIRPAQAVENKLLRLLEGSLLGVSNSRLSQLLCARRPAQS
jgi:hypothetical protein